MIIALLFLILFAILFPGALRFLIVISMLAIGIAASHADSATDAMTNSWQTYNEVCRGSTNQQLADLACQERKKIGAKLEQIGCIYGDNGAYDPDNDGYTCPAKHARARPRQHFEYYTPGQMYSGPLGAHIGAGPHVMAPYTGW